MKLKTYSHRLFRKLDKDYIHPPHPTETTASARPDYSSLGCEGIR